MLFVPSSDSYEEEVFVEDRELFEEELEHEARKAGVDPEELIQKLPKVRQACPIQLGMFTGTTDKPLPNYKHGCVAVGDFFEQVTQALFGKKSTGRLYCDSSADVCPDLQELRRGEFFIESKATKLYRNRGNYFKLNGRNVHAYREMLAGYNPKGSFKEAPDPEPRLLYALWGYDMGLAKVGDYKRTKTLQAALASSIENVYIVDFDIIDSFCNEVSYKTYNVFSSFYALFTNKLKGMSKAPRGFLRELGLDYEDYIYVETSTQGLGVYGRRTCKFAVHILLSLETMKKPSVVEFLSKVLQRRALT